MSFFFVQMANPQRDMFSFFGCPTNEEIKERRQRGINVSKASEKITGAFPTRPDFSRRLLKMQLTY